MRYLAAFVFLAASTAFSAPQSNVTLILKFEGTSSDHAIGELKQELFRLFRESGIHLDVRLATGLGAYPQFEKVVSVSFRGSCQMDRFPRALERQGSLAFSHVTDGEVLPYIEVHCDLVRDLVRSAIVHDDAGRDLLLGRALGRVVAHELYHVLAKTRQHGHGPARAMLSGAELICDRLAFDSADLDKLRSRP
jgi:hypothetical protein